MRRIRKTIPGRLLLLFLAAGLVLSAAEVLPAYPVTASGTKGESNGADFTFTVSPTSATAEIGGSSASFLITVTSQGGLEGTIHVAMSSVSPTFSKGLTFQQIRYDLWISPTAPTKNTYITFTAAKGAVATTYTITITGKDITGGCCYGLAHSAVVTLTVT